MEWYNLVEILAVPVFAFIGGGIGKSWDYKGKKLEVDAKKEESEQRAIKDCKAQHKNDIDNVRAEFKNYFDNLALQIGDINTSVNEIKTEQVKVILNITQLKESQEKYNNVIARTYKLEQDVAVLSNRESVSEHRLTDLEKMA